MGKLLKITGLKRDGTPYVLLLNEGDIRKIDSNNTGEGKWRSVVEEQKTGRSHFIQESIDEIYAQLHRLG